MGIEGKVLNQVYTSTHIMSLIQPLLIPLLTYGEGGADYALRVENKQDEAFCFLEIAHRVLPDQAMLRRMCVWLTIYSL